MKPLFLFGPGLDAPTGDGKRFVKELLREGQYQHPTRPWPQPLLVDERKIDELVANSIEGLKAGVRIPFPITHNDGEDPESNRGFWTRLFKAKNSAGTFSLYGEVEVTNPDTAEQVGKDLRDVSVYIHDFGSGTWAPKGDRIVHACITNYPVFSGQENFVALSASGSVESISHPDALRLSAEPKKDRMKITDAMQTSAKALGITIAGDDLTPDALEKMLSAAAQKVAAQPEAPKVGEDDIPRLLSVDPKADRYFSAYKAQQNAAVEAEVANAEKAGRLTKDMADACRTLLSVTHGFSLSAEGKADKVDVGGLVRKVLSGIPDRAVVPVTPDPAASAGKAPPTDPKQFSAEELKATAGRILAAGGTK